MSFKYLSILIVVISSLNTGFSGLDHSSEMVSSGSEGFDFSYTPAKNIIVDGKVDSTSFNKRSVKSAENVSDKTEVQNDTIVGKSTIENKNTPENRPVKKEKNDEHLTVFGFFYRCISLLFS